MPPVGSMGGPVVDARLEQVAERQNSLKKRMDELFLELVDLHLGHSKNINILMVLIQERTRDIDEHLNHNLESVLAEMEDLEENLSSSINSLKTLTYDLHDLQMVELKKLQLNLWSIFWSSCWNWITSIFKETK